MFVEAIDPVAETALLAQAADETLWARAFSLLTHALFIAVIVRAIHHRHWPTVVLNVLTLGRSLLYHTCQMFTVCIGMDLMAHRAGDRLTAATQIINFGLLLQTPNEDRWKRPVSRSHSLFMQIVFPIQLIGVALAQLAQPYTLYPVVVAVVLVGAGFIINALLLRREPPLRLADADFGIRGYDIHPAFLSASLLSALLGSVLFVVDSPSSTVHSSWHIFAELALLFLLEAVHHPGSTQTVTADLVH